MRYEIKNQSVIFFLDNPKREKETRRTRSFAGTGLSEQQIVQLLESLVRKFRGQSLSSQFTPSDLFLCPLFAYFRANQKKKKGAGISWPATSEEWQLMLIAFFQFFLIDTGWSKSRAMYRMRLWQSRIGGLLEFFKEEEIIPLDVKIPKIDLKQIRSLAKDQPLLGQTRAKISDLGTEPKKLLVDISFGMTDADYLASVEKKCRHLVGVIRDTCMEHWDKLMLDGETGRRLADRLGEIISIAKQDIEVHELHGKHF